MNFLKYINVYLSDFLTITKFIRYLNLLRIPWQYLPDLHSVSRVLPEGDPEAQGLRAAWGGSAGMKGDHQEMIDHVLIHCLILYYPPVEVITIS
jgi:hypothetical protein